MPVVEGAWPPAAKNGVRTDIVLLFVLSASAAAQDYPGKLVKIFVPFGAGGIVDLTIRTVAQKMSKSMRQPVRTWFRSAASVMRRWSRRMGEMGASVTPGSASDFVPSCARKP